jgi:hypothetical protein
VISRLTYLTGGHHIATVAVFSAAANDKAGRQAGRQAGRAAAARV